MSPVTLPSTATDDGAAPGEAVERQSSHPAIRKAEQLLQETLVWSRSVEPEIRPLVNSATLWC
jgi:hypothetical protein